MISNQGGISLKPDTKAPKSHQTKYAAFKSKVSAVFGQLDIPISIYAATEKDIFRKPRTGMWKELLKDYDIHLPGDLDLEQSIFVGDAGGRQAGGGKPKDFSCSDRYGATLSPSSYSDFPICTNFSLYQELCGECWSHVPYTRRILPSRRTQTIRPLF